jgi:probable addiction module antidote protein
MVKIKPFDAAKYLASSEDVFIYLNEALASGDPAFITRAVGTVARSKGMKSIARKTGLSRENLYRLGTKTKPEFNTVMKVLSALNVRLVATPKDGKHPR